MQCIDAPTIDEKKKLLGTPGLRGEICRDLVTQMYSFKQRPNRAFCTFVAKSLIKKYPFMRDSGVTVSGYVSVGANPDLVSNACTHTHTYVHNYSTWLLCIYGYPSMS